MENSTTVDRAARLLFELANSSKGVSVTELAKKLDTQRPPLYRLLKTLSDYRLIRRDEMKLYHLSVGVLELARAVSGPLDTYVKPLIQEAADETGLSAMLLLAEGNALVTALSVTPQRPGMYISTTQGFVHPSGISAPRIAVMSTMPPTPQDSEELKKARKNGYALTTGAVLPGRTALASPVHVGDGNQLGALMFVSDGGQVDNAIPACVATASRISKLFTSSSNS